MLKSSVLLIESDRRKISWKTLCPHRTGLMKRYFFDFDEVPDLCGLTMPSANNACVEALLTMPAYVVEKLELEGGKSMMVCTIRGGENEVLYKIVLSMHIEDGSGTIIESPFILDEVN